jgi:hypothetical protein
MIATRMTIAALVLACATAAAAQTHAELLEKAIFTDETAGDLPGAIRIYEQLLNTPGVSREIAARAQTRLTDGKRRRDQRVVAAAAPSAATPQSAVVVRDRVWNFGAPRQHVEGCCGMFSGNYDPGRPVTVRGKIAQVTWSNPQTLLVIEGSDGNRWGFTLPPPNALLLRGVNKDTFRLGEELLVGGFIAKGETENCPAALPHACATLQNGALHASASIITAGDGKVLFDWATLATAPAVSK